MCACVGERNMDVDVREKGGYYSVEKITKFLLKDIPSFNKINIQQL